MNSADIIRMATSGESERVEFKRSTGQRSEAAKAVCGMLNGIGGYVLFGVTDKGTLTGQHVSAKTLEDIAAELRRIEPPAFPDIEVVSLESGTEIVVLSVTGRGGLYLYDGRPYLRQGPTTIIMPREEYERKLIERLHATRRWENEPVDGDVGITDLDEHQIQDTLEEAVRLGRLESVVRRDTKSILLGLELIRDGRLLNAAVALFGKSDRLKSIYPQLSIRMARFRGINRLADFSDNRQYWGHAFSLLERAQGFLMDHVPIAGRVTSESWKREDQPLYPPRAAREALANALCHRDYSDPGGAVTIAMYDDRLEIVNPGTFHHGITPAQLAGPHESRPWNPIIASALYRAGIIERWGSGTLNIIDWCRENGNSRPEWDVHADSVTLILRPPHVDPALRLGSSFAREGYEIVSEEVGTKSGPSRDQVETKSGPSRDQVGTKSGPSQERIRLLQSAQAERSIVELMAACGRSNRTKFRTGVLQPILDAGLIEMTIPDKPRSSNQRYRLTEAGKRWLDTIGM